MDLRKLKLGKMPARSLVGDSEFAGSGDRGGCAGGL